MCIWQILGAQPASLQESYDGFLLTEDVISLLARVNKQHVVF